MGINRRFKQLGYIFILLIIILQPITLFPRTPVKGIQSGLWSVQNSPYLITDDIIIPKGLTLTIEPGVIITFNGPFRIIVAGGFVALGKPVEPIIITSKFDPIYGFEKNNNNNYNLGYYWYGIDFIDSSDDFLSVLAYCTVRYSKFGIQCHDALPLIKQVYFDEIYTKTLNINGIEVPIHLQTNYDYLSESQRQNPAPVPKPPEEITIDEQQILSEKHLLKLQQQREDSIRAMNKIRPTNVENTVLVFDSKDLDRFGFESLSDLLTIIPGFFQVNSYWENSIVSGRGIAPGLFNNSILVTIDGIPISEGLTNAFNSDLIPINIIDKVAIYTKPQSTYKGKSAFIGHIDIQTKNSEKPLSVTASSQIGSYYSKQIASCINMKKKETNFLISTNYHADEGYNRTIPTKSSENPPVVNFTTDNFTLSMIAKNRGMTFISHYFRQDNGELGFMPLNEFGDSRTREGLQLGIAYSHQFGKRYSADAYVRYAYSLHQYGTENSQPITRYYSNGYSINSQIRMYYRSKKTPASIDIQFIREGAHNLFKPESNSISGLFAEWDIIPGKNEAGFNEISCAAKAGYNFSHFWGIFGGLRYVNTGTGSKDLLSPSVKFVYDPLAPFHATLSFEHGYRSPSILERRINMENTLYRPKVLNPEQIHAVSLSLDYDMFRSVSFQISLYRQAVNNLIIQKQLNSSAIYELINSVNKYQINGLNLNTTYQPNSKIYLFVNSTLHRITEVATHAKILNYPRMNTKTGLGYQMHDRIEGIVHLNFIGKQYSDNPANSIDPFFLINFSLSMKLMQNVSVQFVANNLLNEKCYFMNYADAKSFVIPGEFPRALFIQLKTQF